MEVNNIVLHILEFHAIQFRDMIKEWLDDNEYDGLYCPDGECACLADNLMPCGETIGSCVAGYKVPCPGSPDCVLGGGCGWHIVNEKPKEAPDDRH